MQIRPTNNHDLSITNSNEEKNEAMEVGDDLSSCAHRTALIGSKAPDKVGDEDTAPLLSIHLTYISIPLSPPPPSTVLATPLGIAARSLGRPDANSVRQVGPFPRAANSTGATQRSI